jgi:hypothetical protein
MYFSCTAAVVSTRQGKRKKKGICKHINMDRQIIIHWSVSFWGIVRQKHTLFSSSLVLWVVSYSKICVTQEYKWKQIQETRFHKTTQQQ